MMTLLVGSLFVTIVILLVAFALSIIYNLLQRYFGELAAYLIIFFGGWVLVLLAMLWLTRGARVIPC
jgi:hypothetical protein